MHVIFVFALILDLMFLWFHVHFHVSCLCSIPHTIGLMLCDHFVQLISHAEAKGSIVVFLSCEAKGVLIPSVVIMAIHAQTREKVCNPLCYSWRTVILLKLKIPKCTYFNFQLKCEKFIFLWAYPSGLKCRLASCLILSQSLMCAFSVPMFWCFYAILMYFKKFPIKFCRLKCGC